MTSILTSDFDYELPRELIAAEPTTRRDASRLMVVNRGQQSVAHGKFSDIKTYLRQGDLLVMNDSRVIRARLRGKRRGSGGAVEILLLAREESHEGKDRWAALCRPAKKLQEGELLVFAGLSATVLDLREGGERLLEFNTPDVSTKLVDAGELPLPPYIVQRRREAGMDEVTLNQMDEERYQTVYAKEPGSIAAPTAGLHFTNRLLEEMRQTGVHTATVTLHVGAGTFKPVEVDNPADHLMHEEVYSLSEKTVQAVQAAVREGRRVIAVGTTTVRALESAAANGVENMSAGVGKTRLLILPGYDFKVVSGMVTNFHLPKSSLLMLVSAMAGTTLMRKAYATAIADKYRFYSYGDAMLVL